MNAINANNLTKVRQTGLQALQKALGPVGMVRFIQQFDTGSGDYTKEKYQQPDFTLEEITGQINRPTVGLVDFLADFQEN